MAKNVYEVEKGVRTLGQKLSDRLTNFMGSWAFILLFGLFCLLWVGANIYGWINEWDPYPFIFLNLTLSLMAAIQAPIILMSQRRENQREKVRAGIDFETNQRAEQEIENLQQDINEIKNTLRELKNKS